MNTTAKRRYAVETVDGRQVMSKHTTYAAAFRSLTKFDKLAEKSACGLIPTDMFKITADGKTVTL